MLAQLGSIRFETLGPVTGYQASRQFGYAQQERLAGKPRLQRTADSLEELTLDLRFDQTFCVPADQLAALTELAEAKEPVAFFFANGVLRGRFVIRDLQVSVVHTDARGSVRRADCTVQLLEWAGDAQDLDLLPSAVGRPLGLLDGIVTEARNLAVSYIPPDLVPLAVPVTTITRWGAG